MRWDAERYVREASFVPANAAALATPWLADAAGNVTTDYVRLRFAAVRAA